ncbi:MAG: hypothetical protein ACRCV6_01750 [Formosimonas sp.]
MKSIQLILSAALILAAGLAQAKDFDGEYVGERGFGSVTIQNGRFESSYVSSSGNICELRGRYDKGWVKAQPNCQFKLRPQAGGGFEIRTPERSSCNAECGLNTSVDGVYRPLPKQCTVSNIEQSLERYRQQYHRQQYAIAAQALSQTLNACQPYVTYLTYDQGASELSLSLKKLGQPKACLAVLKKTLAYGQTQAQLQEDIGSVAFDSYLPTAKTIWFNTKACEGIL